MLGRRGVEIALRKWFTTEGAYVLVDGQFGSTGKGVIAGLLAELFHGRVDVVVSNAGPNSGHTSYLGNEIGERKIVLKQLPTFAVVSHKLGRAVGTFLDAGAIIDPETLNKEILEHHYPFCTVHPHAALIQNAHRSMDKLNVSKIASTGQGVGPALCDKVRRNEEAIIRSYKGETRFLIDDYRLRSDMTYFFEVSQGFSLGINSGFYPHVTSRECTVSQALSDAGVPPNFHRKTIMSVRTHPIRVGDTENSSGPCYVDQKELTWDDVGVEPEMTTVTGRQRRIFTWSDIQFQQAVWANAPDVIFLNFCNYLPLAHVDTFVKNHVLIPYRRMMRRDPEAVLLGFGPKSDDVQLYHERNWA